MKEDLPRELKKPECLLLDCLHIRRILSLILHQTLRLCGPHSPYVWVCDSAYLAQCDAVVNTVMGV